MRECLLDQIRAQNDQFSSRRVFLQAICVALLFTASMLTKDSQNSDWTFFCKILSLEHFLCQRADTKTDHMMHNCRLGPEFKYYILAYKSWHSLKLLGSVPYKYLPVKTIMSALPSSYVNLSVCWVGNSER